MADVTSRLRLVVDSTGLDRAGKKLKDLRKDAHDVDNAARQLRNAFSALAGVLGSGFAVGGLIKIAEEFTTIQNSLRLVTQSAGEFRHVLGSLGDISRESQSALETAVALYSRVAQFAGDAFANQQQILDFTGAIQNAFLAAGAGAQEASNAVRQLTQGLASGELRGEEFRSVAEQAPALAKAIAESVGQGSKSAFELAKEGAFTTEVVIDAVLGKMQQFKELAEQITPTLGRAFQVLRDQITLAFGDDLAGVAGTFSRFILDIAGNLESLRPAIEGVAAALGTLGAAFVVGGALTALPVVIGAILSPLGLLAIAIGTVVAFRDDIAEWAFGVEDAGAVVKAAIEVLTPTFQAAAAGIGQFVNDARAYLGGFLTWLGDAFTAIRTFFNQPIPQEAISGVANWASGVINIVSGLAKYILEALTDAFLMPVRAAASAFEGLSKIKFLPEGVRNQFQSIADGARNAADAIDGLAGAETFEAIESAAQSVVTGAVNAGAAVKDTFEDIKTRAKEIAAETATAAHSGLSEEFGLAATGARNAAEATKEISKEAQKSAAAIAQMFSELETERAALLAPTEREGDILRETERLLSQHAEYYKAMGADAERLAQADATRVVDLKQGNKALEARNRLERDFEEQRELINAAGLGEREERIAREVLEIRREIAGISVDEARRLAEQNVILDEQLDLIREQRELIEAPFDNLADNLTDAIINGGREGVGGLGKIFKAFFNDLKTSFLSVILAPLRQGLRSISSMFAGAFTGFGDGVFGPLSRTTPPFVPPQPVGLSVDTMTGFDGIPLETTDLEKFGFRFDGFIDRLKKGFDQLAENFTLMFKNIGELFGGISDKLAKTLGKLGAGAAAGFAGHGLGSGVADFLNGRQGETGGKIGGAVGGGVGFAVGGPLGAFVGSAIGGFFGDIFGGLFGRKTATGTLNFDTGAVTGKDSKKDSRNERRDIILESSASAVQALADILGASFIPGRSLEVKAGKKSIETQIIDALSGAVINIGAKVDDKDVAGALSTAIKLALSSVLEGGDEQLRRIAEAMASANVPAELLVNSLGDIAAIMKSVKEPVSELRQNLETIQQVFADAARASGNFAGAVRELAAAQLEAVQALADNFDKDIKKQLLAINNPLQAQFQELLEVQADRLKDANALNEALLKAAGQATGAPPAPGQTQPGVPASVPANPRDYLGSFLRDIGGMFDEIDLAPLQSSTTLLNAAADGVIQSSELQAEAQERLAAVMELNTAEIVKFFEEVANSPEGLEAAAAGFVEFREQLLATGLDIARVNELLQTAQTAVVTAFDKQIQTDIAQFLNGPLDQLERLLEAQEKRLQQARALGADLTQVERLTALELRQFFQGLSESALNEVKDFLGLFEEASDAVARNLDLSRQDLRGKADAFANFAQEFASLGTDFRERFVAATPRESLDILRGRANDLLGQIGQGNESAAQALPQVLNSLIENARQTFGNTKGFQEVLDFALGILAQAEQSAIGVKTEAERQIAALDESNDLLSEIRDILSSTQAFNALLQSSANGGIASSAELLALIQQGAGLTPSASNDNAAALSITGLIAQSLQPVIAPLATSIDGFTENLSEMPYLQRLQIEATNDSADRIVQKLTDLEDLLDRIEIIDKQNLAELERINRAA